jgi:thimet oligopeptidase
MRHIYIIFAFALMGLCGSGFAQDEAPSSVREAIGRADRAVAAIVAIPDDKRTFANTIEAIDDLTDRLNTETSLFIFMENVSPDAAVRAQARAADQAVSDWASALGKRADLFRAVKAFADTHPVLSGEDARLLKFTLRDYRRSGMDLPKDKRDELAKMDQKIDKLSIDFNQNIADDPTVALFTKAELAGVPSNVMDGWPQTKGLYMVHLGERDFTSLATYAANEETRHKAWTLFKRIGGQKNVDVLEQIIRLRAQEAAILGFRSTADFELEVRMAKNPATVAHFYEQLKPIVRKKALVDYAEFLAEKRKLTHDPHAQINPWDQAYIQNALMKEKYAVDSAKVAEYFPADRVIDGLFSVTQHLYGLTFKDVSASGDQNGQPLWAPGVRYYEVHDVDSGKLLGHFYLDLYPRPGKYSHAACWSLVERKRLPDGSIQLPIAALVVNVAKATASHPALLPHDDVETIFHEFGHCLHNLLTLVTTARFSGTNVELDFVEAPSQMFENWVWSPVVLRTFARHYQTGKPIPEQLLKGMIAARNLGSGLMTEHQMYYGIVDQAYYSVPDGKVDTTKIGIDTMEKVELYHGVPGTMYQASFEHLIGYDAGYYSYLWSLVFAQDMFQRFEKFGLLNPVAGKYYRRTILAKGGSEDASDMLRDFLGREPQLEPFLRHLGMGR